MSTQATERACFVLETAFFHKKCLLLSIFVHYHLISFFISFSFIFIHDTNELVRNFWNCKLRANLLYLCCWWQSVIIAEVVKRKLGQSFLMHACAKNPHFWNIYNININSYVKLRQLRVDNEIVTEKWSGSESSARNWERHRRSSKLETCEAIVFLSKISRLGFSRYLLTALFVSLTTWQNASLQPTQN